MQILFVSSIAAGRSGLSQRQLARRLTLPGHRVDIDAAPPGGAGAPGPGRAAAPPWGGAGGARPPAPPAGAGLPLAYGGLAGPPARLRASPPRPAPLALQRRLGRRAHRSAAGDPPTL